MRRILYQCCFLPVAGLLLLAACQRNDKKKEPEIPYPPVAEQRAALLDKPYATPVRLLDSLQMITDLAYLSSADCQGRQPGTAGHDLSLQRVLERMRKAGVDSFDNALLKTFSGKAINGTTAGKNVAGWVPGTTQPDKYIIVTAHYDHLGTNAGGAIFHGADDNASGTACLLAMAKYFKQHPLPYSLVFAALDREETGLEGAYALADYLVNKLGRQQIVFNINLDMISRSDNNELFACGIWHFPQYRKAIDAVQPLTNTRLLMGHDSSGGPDDWTNQSDHAAFFQKNIPFIYLGVEDHPDYHQPTDTFDKINPGRYLENANLVLLLVKAIKP